MSTPCPALLVCALFSMRCFPRRGAAAGAAWVGPGLILPGMLPPQRHRHAAPAWG